MRIWTTFLLSLMVAVGAWAQKADPSFDPVKSVSLGFQGGAVVLSAPPGAHLKSAFMAVEKQGGPGSLKVGKLPPGDAKDEIGDPVWHGTVRIPVSGTGLAGTVALAVTYQPCTEGEGGVCYPPTTRTLQVKAAEIPAEKGAEKPAVSPVAETKAESKPEAKVEAPAAASSAPPPAVPAPAPESSLLWSFLLMFLAGLGASLTPCVYPMIPITMAIIGAKGGGKAKGFVLSLALVLGMAVTYTTLGVVAAKSGAAFGAFAQKPSFLIPVSLVFAVFALSLFGAFEIRLPAGLAAKLQGDGSRSGLGGAFVMGLVLGPLSAPCVGPIVGSVLVGIAQHGQVWLGASQLFVFSLGMGVLFLAVGTFSAGLPRSGDWLTRLKQGMGLVVLGFAAWNVRLLVPDWVNAAMWSGVLLVGAGVFGAFEAVEGLVPSLRRAAGLLFLVLGLLLGVKAVEAGLDVHLLPQGGTVAAPAPAAGPWLENDFEGALAKAKAEQKLVLVDTYAQWCAQCKELDEKTWPDPAVQAWIRDHAVAVRIDTDKVRPDLATKLRIQSYPTVLLLDAEGREVRRSLGFQKPMAMLAWLDGK
ncbi:thiol:disulfide interchange protein DsbD [Geothrix rubra]|uniref:Thiol:disulfide interchange protein DsbD n=1 Tax=Geothrix rubra TaxID=2927977 RepID=A0ABQ5Q5H3_9BACT|nr:cytochrome c biogenesis protein CcdA [Geothrix rubra]GLH69645.1 thiol:disulfide interchange protein DsbD [Geothrix rubra]